MLDAGQYYYDMDVGPYIKESPGVDQNVISVVLKF